jgi:hypothetical protein
MGHPKKPTIALVVPGVEAESVAAQDHFGHVLGLRARDLAIVHHAGERNGQRAARCSRSNDSREKNFCRLPVSDGAWYRSSCEVTF